MGRGWVFVAQDFLDVLDCLFGQFINESGHQLLEASFYHASQLFVLFLLHLSFSLLSLMLEFPFLSFFNLHLQLKKFLFFLPANFLIQ